MSTYNFKKAMTHIGFEINSGIPRKIFLTTGKGGERPFVIKILEQGETGVLVRGYQSHNYFDSIQIRRQAFRLPDQN